MCANRMWASWLGRAAAGRMGALPAEDSDADSLDEMLADEDKFTLVVVVTCIGVVGKYRAPGLLNLQEQRVEAVGGFHQLGPFLGADAPTPTTLRGADDGRSREER